MTEQVTVALTLTRDEAVGLSQFVKRADRDTAGRYAGDMQEAAAIYESWIAIRNVLAEAGYAPR